MKEFGEDEIAKVTKHNPDGTVVEQDFKTFLRERLEFAPTAPARVVRGQSREQIKEIAIKAYSEFIDEILKNKLVKNNMMIVKMPLVLFYTGESEIPGVYEEYERQTREYEEKERNK